MAVRSHHLRVNLQRLTGSTAPPRVRLTFSERNNPLVKASGEAALLLGPLRILYYIERVDPDGFYLSRWDVEEFMARPGPRVSRQRRQPSRAVAVA